MMVMVRLSTGWRSDPRELLMLAPNPKRLAAPRMKTCLLLRVQITLYGSGAFRAEPKEETVLLYRTSFLLGHPRSMLGALFHDPLDPLAGDVGSDAKYDLANASASLTMLYRESVGT
jgi:hypothetical protein